MIAKKSMDMVIFLIVIERGVFARPQMVLSCKLHLDLVTRSLKLGRLLKDPKESNPVNVAELAKASGL